MEEILKDLGAVTWWEGHDLYLDCTEADGIQIPAAYTRKNALFCDSAGTCAEQEPQLSDRLSGRLCDRKKANRSSSDGIEASGC